MPTLQLGDPNRPPLEALQGILFSKRSGGKSSARVQDHNPNVPIPNQQLGNSEDSVVMEETMTHVISTVTDFDSRQTVETPRGEYYRQDEQGWLPWNWGRGETTVQSL